MSVTISCPMCVGEVEHLRHLFFKCSFAKECLHLMGLEYDMSEVEYVSTWMLNILASGSPDELTKLSTTLWGIWFARNKLIFENKHMPPAVTKTWSQKQVEEWQVANRRPSSAHADRGTSRGIAHRWRPPDMDQFKVNVDASVVEGRNSFALGMILRNHHGQFIAVKTMKIAVSVSVMEAELTGILEALLWS